MWIRFLTCMRGTWGAPCCGPVLPQAKIVLTTETPLTKDEVIQALQGVLALNGIALINIGDKFVKAVPVAQASQEGAAFNDHAAAQLPDVGQYVTHIVQLKYIKPSELAPVLQQFAKIPNAVFPIDSNGILILRDYAENVKRMLEFVSKVDVVVPEEFISEVIPIKYAMVDDIANALNSLGGSSSAIGNATTPSSRGAGFGNTGTPGNPGGQYQPGGINQPGGQTARPFGAASGGGQYFQPAITVHHPTRGGGRRAGGHSTDGPDQNHRRRTQQFVAGLCHERGHENHQRHRFQTGRAVAAGPDRVGDHGGVT